MSSARRPEFFFDRSLGRRTAHRLGEAGWTIHLIADHYPDDADGVSDTEWIAEGCIRKWALLTKDQKIRYRSDELAALEGQLFCLSSGKLQVDEMVRRFDAARSNIDRVVATGEFLRRFPREAAPDPARTRAGSRHAAGQS